MWFYLMLFQLFLAWTKYLIFAIVWPIHSKIFVDFWIAISCWILDSLYYLMMSILYLLIFLQYTASHMLKVICSQLTIVFSNLYSSVFWCLNKAVFYWTKMTIVIICLRVQSYIKTWQGKIYHIYVVLQSWWIPESSWLVDVSNETSPPSGNNMWIWIGHACWHLKESELFCLFRHTRVPTEHR